MRNFVRSHPAYKGDSVISDEIAYDLVQTCTDIGLGKSHIPELLGNVFIDPITAEGAYEVKLDSKRAHNERILELLKRYKTRGSFRSSFISR
jgi:glutamate--cysteine ligase catalytic subunit